MSAIFVPPMYREPDARWVDELIRRNPLALLVTNGAEADGPRGTHLPVIADPDSAAGAVVATGDVVLFGHMNRANPQWKALGRRTPAMLSFAGPHAYVSPALYPPTPAAPTWDFTAVQVRGTVDTIDSPEETLSVVRSTAEALEAEFGEGWDLSGSMDHFRRILPGVGAFRFTVTRSAAMFKLSQEQSSETRERVCHHFALAPSAAQRETARYMNRLTGENLP